MTVYRSRNLMSLVVHNGITAQLKPGDLVNITDEAAFDRVRGLVLIGALEEVKIEHLTAIEAVHLGLVTPSA